MKADKRLVLYYGATIVQVVLFGLLIGVEILSGYRAGLAQHLYYKKVYYLTHFYQGIPLYLHGVVVLLLTFFTVKILLRQRSNLSFSLYKYLGLFLLLVVTFVLPWTNGLAIYSYLIMTLELFLIFEAVSVIWLVWRKK